MAADIAYKVELAIPCVRWKCGYKWILVNSKGLEPAIKNWLSVDISKLTSSMGDSGLSVTSSLFPRWYLGFRVWSKMGVIVFSFPSNIAAVDKFLFF